VNTTLSEMDETTQQNAALVEQAAAAAASMQDQAANLARVVAVFKLDQQATSGPALSTARPMAALRKEKLTPALANGGSDWESL
jgi:methyl-accepting chemotaxis protein